VARLREGLGQLARNTRTLQESVMRLRSMPVSQVFNRFPRLVHDLSRQLGKRVELRLHGQTTEIDKTVLERLGDPLVHLVRNSLDHGLEGPEERAAAGKAETGVLEMSATHRGRDIVIEVTDDGRGLDLPRILARARDRGILPAGAIPDEASIIELIFAPGFSTAASVTDVSGRGVGMDVVRRNVRSLGGEIRVSTTRGQGTRTQLRLPLTLAIVDGQLVRVGRNPYVVPLLSIVESVQVQGTLIKRNVDGQRLYRLRDDLVPMFDLGDLLGATPTVQTANFDNRLLVVVEAEGRKLGLLVDELQGQQQVVVKTLEANYQPVPGLAGATILGDGSIAFILDTAGLATLAAFGVRRRAA
jgi:two-component system chemotaxis sensor kinase CheA